MRIERLLSADSGAASKPDAFAAGRVGADLRSARTVKPGAEFLARDAAAGAKSAAVAGVAAAAAVIAITLTYLDTAAAIVSHLAPVRHVRPRLRRAADRRLADLAAPRAAQGDRGTTVVSRPGGGRRGRRLLAARRGGRRSRRNAFRPGVHAPGGDRERRRLADGAGDRIPSRLRALRRSLRRVPRAGPDGAHRELHRRRAPGHGHTGVPGR